LSLVCCDDKNVIAASDGNVHSFPSYLFLGSLFNLRLSTIKNSDSDDTMIFP